MTFTSEDMISAMIESRGNHRFIRTEEANESFSAGFYAGALWSASRTENDRFDPCCMKCGSPLLTDELVCKECKI